jgi:methionine sulfoxide reductase catalytic subunit
MSNIHINPSWHLPESAATPESLYVNRREFLRTMGLGGMALAGTGFLTTPSFGQDAATPKPAMAPLPPYATNPAFADAGRPLTEEKLVYSYNNFYEFGFSKSHPATVAKGFSLSPYTLKIDGLVDKPLELDLDDIEKLGCEERVYRHRCVEAWSMVVPWLGVPLRKLVEKAKPTSDAKYVVFTTFYDPERAPGQKDTRYKWPYTEGLRLDEAMNDLAFVTTGLFGKRLLPQSGTPLRIVVPWKYGYKGPKSIVRMSFVDKQPETFWMEAVASEYKFYSNVDPKVPHPRWSQAKELYLGGNTKSNPTQWYNGYGEQVAHLYADMPRTLY